LGITLLTATAVVVIGLFDGSDILRCGCGVAIAWLGRLVTFKSTNHGGALLLAEPL
jgi:hypothetical protein